MRPDVLTSPTIPTASADPSANPSDRTPAAGGGARSFARGIGVDVVLAAAFAAALAAYAFVTSGGDELGPNTWAEIVLVLAGAGLGAAALLRSAPGRAWGAGTIALFAALAVLTIVSIAWSVQPADSWVEANRTLSYVAAFGGALALARLAPARWPALVGAIGAGATIICGYSLLAKVFPSTFDPIDPLGRLRVPFDYWNAVGLIAAIGLPPCVWAGARRERGRALRALAVPAISVLLSTLVLSYSRSALIAAVVALACWFALVPFRLRAAAVLAIGGVGAAAITTWAIETRALTHDDATLAARTSAGHGFGLVLVLVLALTFAAGFAVAYASDRAPVPELIRRRVAVALLVAVGLVPVGGIVAVAASQRGLIGEISHVWDSLTSRKLGVVGDTPGRLLEIGNSRGRYWNEGITVGEHSVFKGVGAGGFATARRYYTNDPLSADHAHSYEIQTFADLGLLGIGISLATLLAWLVAASRATGLRPRAAPLHAAERAGMCTLLAVVIVYGIQSSSDWTSFFPGPTAAALVCAGWLAGRGPLTRAVNPPPTGRRGVSPAVVAALTAFAAITLLGAWAMLQPLRSADANTAAITALNSGNTVKALSDARTAANSDPLSIDPLLTLWAIYARVGDTHAAGAELRHATHLQPRNAQTWLALGEYDLKLRRPRRALAVLETARRLDLGLSETQGAIKRARAALAAR
jgi:hypothetical protein